MITHLLFINICLDYTILKSLKFCSSRHFNEINCRTEMADIDNEHHVFSACNKIRYISLFFFLSTTDWNHILFALYSKIDISSLELKQDCKMYSE